MDFLNTQIDPTTLPRLEDVEWKPVERIYMRVLRIRWLIFTAVLLAIVSFVLSVNPVLRQTSFLIIAGLLVFIPSFLYIFLVQRAFKRRAYALREYDILYRHGWLFQTTDACPFNRIQHCSVNSGPLERNYSLASLSIYTAASGEADIKISGLKEETANSIRELIMKKIIPYDGEGN